MIDIKIIRNIGIIAHIDAGKTTTTERILYYTGQEYKMGNVDEGTTITDYMPEEKKKGITITSANVTCHWKDHAITIIDTPGHIDFTAEVERSLRVLDGAVGIFCAVGGVEAQSETVWRQSDHYKIPRIAYINKMDRVGADFAKVVDELATRLKANPVVINFPWGKESEFRGVIDVIDMKAKIFLDESQGKEVEECEIPEEYLAEAESYREQLIDALADFDDEIIEKFSDNTLEKEDFYRTIRQATIANKITPIFTGSSLKYKGVQTLLDAIVAYLPSPLDVPPVIGYHPKTEKSIQRSVDDKDLCALAFKSTFNKHGDIVYVRIYSGILKEGMQVFNPLRNKTERINRLSLIYADKLLKCESVGPGHIVGVVGLRDTITGDTLCTKKNPIILEKMAFPETVVSMAIEPKTMGDKDQMIEVLKIVSRDDPTFAYQQDEETGQVIISGMGELHLEIISGRLLNEHKLKINIGKPRVSYRETILKKAEGEHEFDKIYGNKDHYAYIKVKVEPNPEGGLEVKNHLTPNNIPKNFFPAVEEGVRSALSSGELAGYPLFDVKVTILSGRSHASNSTDMAFNKAAYEATLKAMTSAGYALLEPIMNLTIQTPVNYVGDIINNLNSKRAEIREMELRSDIQNITSYVPLAEMFGYISDLRTLSQGRASYTMEPLKYQVVPKEIQDKIIDPW